MNVLEYRCRKYSDGRANEVLTQTIAQAYAEGYRDGYKDRDEGLKLEHCEKNTVFVDLGLPSGTLWAVDYEKQDDKVLYLPYQKAKYLHIPTEVLWEDLYETCEQQSSFDIYEDLYGIKFIGPNGNYIEFSSKGYRKVNKLVDKKANGAGHVYFWINSDDEIIGNNAIHFGKGRANETRKENGVTNVFPGFSLPIRLIRTK